MLRAGKDARQCEFDGDGGPHSTPEARVAKVRRRLVGESPAFRDMLRVVTRVAVTDAPVLLQGETGTGKELVARSIHFLGPARNEPFVPVNCGAIPDGLFDSELFGHQRGAFTDAKREHIGLIAHAEGGTLFLDEVDALSHKGQVSLLRFLQDGEYRPVGSTQPRRAHVRLIAASNADLRQCAHAGAFREDLLFRLAVLSFVLPPLRARGDDVLLLAEHFVRAHAASRGQEPGVLGREMYDALEGYAWPGNVRELENFIHGACALSVGRVIDLPAGLISGPRPSPVTMSVDDSFECNFQAAKARVIERFERAYLMRLIERSDGNVTRAAELCGKERRALGKLLKKYGLHATVQRPGVGGARRLVQSASAERR